MKKQVAALPLRRSDDGKLQVMLITSRDSGRWVPPKGGLMKGKKPWEAAAIEAEEEAGIRGKVNRSKMGEYHYAKRLKDGSAITCKVDVFPLPVTKLKKNWKEKAERKRKWFPPELAAELVDERELSEIIANIR